MRINQKQKLWLHIAIAVLLALSINFLINLMMINQFNSLRTAAFQEMEDHPEILQNENPRAEAYKLVEEKNRPLVTISPSLRIIGPIIGGIYIAIFMKKRRLLALYISGIIFILVVFLLQLSGLLYTHFANLRQWEKTLTSENVEVYKRLYHDETINLVKSFPMSIILNVGLVLAGGGIGSGIDLLLKANKSNFLAAKK